MNNVNLEYLRTFHKIIVTGPQRSGTTILSKMLAHDMNYKLVDEDDYHVHDLTLFNKELCEMGNKVIHAPAMSHVLHRIQQTKTIIIWVIRDFESIRDSVQRIQWDVKEEQAEKVKYTFFPNIQGIINGPIEKVKYNVWMTYQKRKLCVPHVEILYGCEYMTSHNLWLDKTKRIRFHPRQTSQ